MFSGVTSKVNMSESSEIQMLRLENARLTALRRNAELRLNEAEATILELEESVRTLRYRAEHEPVTGLLRKEVAEREIVATMGALDDEEKKRTCLLYLDIDDFKVMNDSFGHNEGDIVLKRVAIEITSTIKRGDFAGRGDSGDEFIVFLRDASEQEAIEIGELISLRVSRRAYYALDSQGQRTKYHTGISLGVAQYSGEIPFDEWKHMADQDMYVRKRARKAAKGA